MAFVTRPVFFQLFGLLQGPWQDKCGGLPCQIQRNGFGYSPPVYRDLAADAPGQAWPAITNLRSLQPHTLSTLWQVWVNWSWILTATY